MPDQRILIVRLGAIGDVLRVLPALRRLRVDRPDAEIGWAIEHWTYPVVAGNPNVDRFHVLDRASMGSGRLRSPIEIARFVRELRSYDYDVAVDLHARLKSGVISLACGAAQRIGYSRQDSSEANHLFSNRRVCLPDRYENRVQRFLHAFEELGARPEVVPGDFGVAIDPELRERAESWHRDAGEPTLAIYPGSAAKHADLKRWPADRWVGLLRRLVAQGLSAAAFWGPGERDLAGGIADAVGSGCVLAPRTTLPEMMALLGRCRLFIGSNTAAMHMAWLQQVPTVFFAGPALPRTDAPFGGVPHRALWASGPYHANPKRRDRAGCVREVSVDEAQAAVLDLLASR